MPRRLGYTPVTIQQDDLCGIQVTANTFPNQSGKKHHILPYRLFFFLTDQHSFHSNGGLYTFSWYAGYIPFLCLHELFLRIFLEREDPICGGGGRRRGSERRWENR